MPAAVSALATVVILSGAGATAASPRPGHTAHSAARPMPCSASQLQARAAWEGAPGMVIGGIVLTNVSHRPCILRGHPHPRLFGGTGAELPVTARRAAPWYQVRTKSRSHVVRPGRRALVTLMWTNWCGSPVSPPITAHLTLPGEDVMTVPIGDDLPRETSARTPGCGGPGHPSLLQVGSFVVVPANNSLPWIP